MRENRPYGSEGGEVQKPSLPLSRAVELYVLLDCFVPPDCDPGVAPRNDD